MSGRRRPREPHTETEKDGEDESAALDESFFLDDLDRDPTKRLFLVTVPAGVSKETPISFMN